MRELIDLVEIGPLTPNALASRRAALRGREVPPPPEAGALALTTWLYGALRGREVPPPPEAE